MQPRERDFIRQLFNLLDEEKDGELEPEEMQNAFRTLFQLELSDKKWQVVIKNVDFQQDGNVQFTEFLVATCKRQLLFNNETLNAAF